MNDKCQHLNLDDDNVCLTCGDDLTEIMPCSTDCACSKCLDDLYLDDENCDHSDVEDCTCLICGKDLTEDMMSRAYDFCKCDD